MMDVKNPFFCTRFFFFLLIISRADFCTCCVMNFLYHLMTSLCFLLFVDS
ncbi:hypothetical protein GLYMA_11G146400v4 [Glycine max]|uniref:Uncharacterized protein n=1 Tax=Glycine max TaxID=3847 RepID=K7LQG1_SOYBN|nr:hypothetical protein JHK85_032003 [Glycine max]KAH1159468.1 hypothetical protein GYH30_031265 [Glycine max]KRH29918.1 hypothetical protein GLYMA_11G146400v4 [Glycine max]